MAAKPTVFVGSSKDHIDIAYAVQDELEHDAVVVVRDQAFDLGSGTLENLEKQLDDAHFAILILAPDDITVSRGRTMSAPRDNVLFELGLFIGRLGRDRAYYLYDSSMEIKLPTDLAGITGASYTPPPHPTPRNWRSAVDPASKKIRHRLTELQAWRKLDRETQAGFTRHQAFRESLQGAWWEFLLNAERPVVSYLTIEADSATSTVRLRGEAFGSDAAQAVTVWESIGSILHVPDRRLYYTWKGYFNANPNEPYEGFEEVVFDGNLTRGTGTYFHINVTKLEATTREAVRMERCSDDEITTMESRDDAAKHTLIAKKLNLMPRT